MKKVIFMYDFTGIAAQPWLDAGYECYLFDGQHEKGETVEGNLHKIGMWLERDDETIQKILEYVGKVLCLLVVGLNVPIWLYLVPPTSRRS